MKTKGKNLMSESLRVQILDFIVKKYKIRGDKPWRNDPEFVVVRHPDNKKWFGLIMPVPRKKLKLSGNGSVDVINLKTDPIVIGGFKNQNGILPAWHMNKSTWCSVVLDGTVPISDIQFLINVSFDLTRTKCKTKD
ncbi:MAG: MmcQ/YjbR family DNA-binding protein [Alphaproteobacteria bacterium]|nr:MmcQ/YjbR family DNA-binding protein [Alphaproteobacteria bacterium]